MPLRSNPDRRCLRRRKPGDGFTLRILSARMRQVPIDPAAPSKRRHCDAQHPPNVRRPPEILPAAGAHLEEVHSDSCLGALIGCRAGMQTLVNEPDPVLCDWVARHWCDDGRVHA
jgi:hypothetical protein